MYRTNYGYDLIVIIAFALMFFIVGDTRQITKIVIPEETESVKARLVREIPLPDIPRSTKKSEQKSHLEETPEFSAVMYATEPIGRYFITAYNHEETGSKITASGKTCHEGTITSCAIDPKLHRFGEYFEITVNGEPRLFVAEDTGRLVRNRHVDLYFSSYKAMAKYNSNYQTIYKVSFPFGKPKYD